MESNNTSPLRQVLEEQSTEVLHQLLDRELHKETVNGDSVRMILSVLRSRAPVSPPEPLEVTEALARYQALVDRQDAQHLRARKGKKLLIQTLSLAAVLVLILAVTLPQQASAGSFQDRLIRWTEKVVDFFTPQDNDHRIVVYEFQTEHPGLQEVYNAAVEMGITEPVVPMWLPEEYALLECKLVSTPSRSRLSSSYFYGDSEIILNIDKYDHPVSREFQEDGSFVNQYEVHGTIFFIVRNNDVWTAVWSQDTIECSLFIDCQEDMLYKILKSIYNEEA